MKTDELGNLVSAFENATRKGQLENSSEATIRAWIDSLLAIYGWDVKNTNEVLTEHTLEKEKKAKLTEIDSPYSRPDYTLVNGKIPLAFVDAKSLSVDIEKDKKAAFQIRSYGWTIGAGVSIVTNFRQMAIYDCTVKPNCTDEASFARIIYLTSDQYVNNAETLTKLLEKANIINGIVKPEQGKRIQLDDDFSALLGKARIEIGRSILSNKTISQSSLNLYIQIIINRILFIRVCEARGLEKDGLLKKYAESSFWTNFKASSYAHFYDRYDGPIFKKIPSIQSLEIDDSAFKELINSLYYPSPYRFDVIPLKTISDIYDLFLGYELIIRGNELSNELKSEFRKSNGAITTPMPIVNDVLNKTIDHEKISNLDIENILNLKFIDIACGSGVFLTSILEYLINVLEEKLTRQGMKNSELAIWNNGKAKLSLKGKMQIISNCLFGVDINQEAVEVSKLSLCLKMIDNYQPIEFEDAGLLGHQILCGVGENIKCGNSLVNPDIEIMLPEISERLEELERTNSFDWRSSFPQVFPEKVKGGFDYVISNPPYVEVRNYNENLPLMAKYIKKVYHSATDGRTDLCIPFIEKGVNLLNKDGRLGYIIQKRFFKTEYGKKIRKLLTSKNCLLNQIYDYNETDLFRGVITYVAVIVCDANKINNKTIHYQRNSENFVWNIPAWHLDDLPWNFENIPLNKLRSELTRKLGTLKKICDIKVGLQVLWNNAYRIIVDKVQDGLIYGHSKIDDSIIIEEGACRPIICNKSFVPMSKLQYSTYVIFPYDVTGQGQKAKPILFSELRERYPKAAAYLLKHQDTIKEKVETLPKKRPNCDEEESWHLYTRLNNPDSIDSKICVPMTCKYSQACVVLEKNIYFDNANVFFIQPHVNNTDNLYALAAFINSTIFSNFARSIANPQQGGYFKINKQFLAPLPFPVQAFKQRTPEIKRLAELAKQIEMRRVRIQDNTNPGKSKSLLSSIKIKWEEIDHICCKLYNLTDEQEEIFSRQAPRTDR